MGEHRVPTWTYKSVYALATVAIVAAGAQASAPLQRAGVPFPVADEAPLNVDGGVPQFLEPPSDLPPLLDSQVTNSGDFGGSYVLAAAHGIPATVLAAYRNAETELAASDPSCAMPAALLAAIGRIESRHASNGNVDSTGRTLSPIVGPRLDGAPGYATISDTDGGRWDGDTVYDRAVGPMQFIPSTWSRWGTDGNHDGLRDPQNVFDASLASGEYLCAGGREMTNPVDLRQAILSYNHSEQYLQTVLAWMNVYANGAAAIADARMPASKSSATTAAKPASSKKAAAKSSNTSSSSSGGSSAGDDSSSSDDPSAAPSAPSDPATAAATEVKKSVGTVTQPACTVVESVIDPVTGILLKLSEPACLTAAEQDKLEAEGGSIDDGVVTGVPPANTVLRMLLGL